MCTCASCKYTHGKQFQAPLVDGEYVPGSNFALWPKGEPAGTRRSAAAYAAHWTHCGAEFHSRRAAFKPGMPAAYPSWVTCQINMPIPQAPAWVRRAINPGVSIDADTAAPAAVADNVPASQPERVKVPRQSVPAIEGASIADLLEQAIRIRGERPQERIAA